MKATDFIKEILAVSNAILTKSYDYSIDKDREFIQIYLTTEPNVAVKAMCEEKGYYIKENTLWTIGQEGKVSQKIWQLYPVNTEDYEFLNK